MHHVLIQAKEDDFEEDTMLMVIMLILISFPFVDRNSYWG